MFIFRRGSRRAVAATASAPVQSYASRAAIKIPTPKPPVPLIDSCPSPTCACRPMPAGLDIEREQDLNGTMASYAEQVLISTGKSDWTSRIEDEEGVAGDVVRGLKGLLGPKGKLSDPYHNVLLTASSFEASIAPQDAGQGARYTSAYLLPSFKYIPEITMDHLESLTKGFLLPEDLHQAHSVLNPDQQKALERQPELQADFPYARPVKEILVLICGHGGRDARCGTLGPILQAGFEDQLKKQAFDLTGSEKQLKAGRKPARVGLISHIGGHKWAGNVIIYIPPSLRIKGERHPLAGKGIWYGRVEPGHVEGIVAETVGKANVVKDLFRGGIEQGGKILRL